MSFLPTTGLETVVPGMINHRLAYLPASIAAQAASVQSFNGFGSGWLSGRIPSPTGFITMPPGAVMQPGPPGSAKGVYSNGLTQYFCMKLFLCDILYINEKLDPLQQVIPVLNRLVE